MKNTNINHEKKNFLVKAWEKYQNQPGAGKKDKPSFTKSKSYHSGGSIISKRKIQHQEIAIAPMGCFYVYVGPEKQRFAIKAKYANHPLFTMLLEDAEMEYGHNSNGPILLPCEVDLFYKVVAEMEEGNVTYQNGCGLGYGSCSPFNPTRRLGSSDMGKGYGSYGFLTPSRLLRIN